MSTVVLDIYEGWTADQLKTRCRELCRALMQDEQVILTMAQTPGAMDSLHPDDRARVQRLCEAYQD